MSLYWVNCGVFGLNTYRETYLKHFRKSPRLKNRSVWKNGSRFDSKLESKVAQDLEFRKLAGDIKEWEKQINVPLFVNGEKITTYRVDFRVYHNDGTIEWIEAKGFETEVWRLKRNLFMALIIKDNPNESYTVVK